jgi:hypothetical protein
MKRGLLFSVVLLCVALVSASAHALSYGLNIEYTGASEPEGQRPWLTATFEDAGTNTVTLTMDATNLVDNEFVGKWFFNMDDAVVTDPFLVFTHVSGPATPPSFGLNNKDAAGAQGAGFDILFDFPQNNGNRFGTGETSVYRVELTNDSSSTLMAESFNFTNEAGNFYSAAHVQGIGPTGDDSGWIAATSTSDIPEAKSILSLGLGILVLGLVAHKRRLR